MTVGAVNTRITGTIATNDSNASNYAGGVYHDRDNSDVTLSKNHHRSGNLSHKAAKACDSDNDARPSLPERSRVRIVQIKRD
jgi:hypothetical protein